MLRTHDLRVDFANVQAVAGVDIELPEGPFGLGLVGESGSGKTTIGRAVARLVDAADGSIEVDGRDITRITGSELRSYRRRVQMVFQDIDGVLTPRMKVGTALAEVLTVHHIVPRTEIRATVTQLLTDVGLDPELAQRRPHELSGGQKQRITIARALAVRPRTLIFDEPTSALDVTVQNLVLETIEQIRAEHELNYLLISHNLAVVQRLCEQVAVLYLGRIVESGPTNQILRRPAHPYTLALRSAVPTLDPQHPDERIVLHGPPPDAANPPSGCAFHPRCPLAIDICSTQQPPLQQITPGRQVACHRSKELLTDPKRARTP
ncbi:ABC transporter ATP-binding protein [Streptomyces antibioticus]|uniref:ABC transporter ATP-binding protein n=1 Tax=Streptomyces antibioticus TaxID=1890 RepID=UPI0033B5B3B1